MPNRVGQIYFSNMEKDERELCTMFKEVKHLVEERPSLHTLTSVDHLGDSWVCLSPLEDRLSYHKERHQDNDISCDHIRAVKLSFWTSPNDKLYA